MATQKIKHTILRRSPIAAAVVMGLTSQAAFTATVNVSNSGSMNTTLAPAAATFSSGDTLNITNTATGNINVSGTGEQTGISGIIGGNSVINAINNGTISANTSTANLAYGIRAQGGTVNVTNTGSITAISASNANAIQAFSAVGDTTIVSHGDLTATDTAIYSEVTGNNAKLSVTASGKIQSGLGTLGTRDGIELYTKGSNSDISVDFQSGSIETFNPAGSNNTARGITAIALNDGSVNVKTGANTTIKTESINSDGIYAVTNSTATKREVAVDSGSIITTSGSNAAGIRAVNKFGDISIESTGAINTSGTSAHGIVTTVTNGKETVNNSGAITTTGNSAIGIYAGSTSGEIEINSAGKITTSGFNGHGIYTQATKDTKINVLEDILTQGANSYGINVVGNNMNNATVNIATAANKKVSTVGSNARGISAVINAGGNANNNQIIIDNQSTIASDGTGIHAQNYAGNIKITSTGDITTKSASAPAIYAASTDANGGDIDIAASGVLSTLSIGDSTGIRATANNSANINVAFSGPSITATGGNSDGIYANTTGTGNVNVTTTGGTITAGGATNVSNSYGVIIATNSGNAAISNAANIVTGASNASSSGVVASTGSGKATVINTGNIVTGGANSHGVKASSNTGEIQINNQGKVVVDGEEAVGVYATSNASDISILNSGEITTNGLGTVSGAAGIRARISGAGNATIISTGANITTNGAGKSNHGIEAVAYNGVSHAEFVNGTISVSGKSAGIAAWNGPSSLASSAEVIITNGIIDATRSYDQVAAQAFALDSGSVDIDAGSQVHGGWDKLGGTIYSGRAVSAGGATQRINNAGVIDALSDKAVAGDATTAGNLSIKNSGQITGSITSRTGNAALTNTGTWNIRNFADTNGDQVRDTLSVAVNDFGTSGNNSINNSGVITLLGDNAQASNLNNTGEYATGYAANTLALGGAAQGQILGVQTFTNSGVIDLSANSSVGDVLLISGSNTAGTAGGGVYIADGGQIKLDTVLNEGGLTNSQSDMLVVDSTRLGSGATSILVNNVGGTGANTVDNGIELVRVLDSANSAAGVFKLGARTTAGLYEYDLFQGDVDANVADGNWYLRSLQIPGQPDTPAINPESTVYLRNLNAAATMFMHTLHDRLGEPQFTDPYKTDDNNPSSAWVRVVSNHTDSVGGNGQVDLNTDTNLVHLGTDIARWSSDGNDRWLFGVMGAYGQSKIDASAKYFAVTPSGFERNATGKVDGYSVGAYATWYGNKDKPEGAYVDTWAQYGWYDNKVQGNTKAEERYNSSGWTASVEAGYAMVARAESKNRQWIFEPQVQVAYNNYSSNDHTDASGTRITDDNANGVITRVGARLYGRSTQNDNGIQPFVEANWWYSDAKNSLSFNGQTMEDGTPDSRYEVKVGLQGQVANNWLIWGHAGVQYGSNDFNRYEGMVGIKRMF